MRNDAFRSTGSKVLAAVFVAASTLLLSSCGGGGAASTAEGGVLTVQPNPGTAYAGIPFRLSVIGGRAPYFLGSSEPSIFPVPATTNDNFMDILPGQPGVIDTGLQAGEVPRRAVVVNARDSNGLISSATLSVLQNFLIGYGVSYSSTCPAAAAAAGATAAATQACPGNETVIRMAPTFNGQLRGNALMRFERIRGDFTFFQCGTNPTLGVNSITQNTDHTGLAQVCIYVPQNAPTQFAAYRIIDVATGVYADQIFQIVASVIGAPTLTAIPNTVTLTGTNGRCGTGSSDFLVFGGSPPYSATSTNPQVIVAPASSASNPGRFSVTVVNNAPPCPTGAVVNIIDSVGARGTVTVTSVQGAAAPAIQVAPAAFTLNCQQSGTAVVVGGGGPLSAFASGGGVSASVSGNQVVITRTGGPVGAGTQQTTVNITDGASIATITVDSPATCV